LEFYVSCFTVANEHKIVTGMSMQFSNILAVFHCLFAGMPLIYSLSKNQFNQRG